MIPCPRDFEIPVILTAQYRSIEQLMLDTGLQSTGAIEAARLPIIQRRKQQLNSTGGKRVK